MRIITRLKGSKKYFYAQHSYRQNGKVITREKYLGVRVPAYIGTILNSFKQQLQFSVYAKLERISAHFQREWKRFPMSAQEKELEQIAIAFTYNTNAIEGSTITLDETLDIIHYHIAPNKPIRDVKETEAHSVVFIAMLQKKEPVTKTLLLQWHAQVFGETKKDIAGKYRDYLVRVGEYIAPNWQDVEKLMSELIAFIRKTEENPVELAARVHFRFEQIHPFGDGNGRIGRLLMNQMLWHAGYPMLIIEYKGRKSYYRALQRGEDAFVQYFLRRYLAVHKKRICAE